MWETRWSRGLVIAMESLLSQSMLKILSWLLDENKQTDTQAKKPKPRHFNIIAFQKPVATAHYSLSSPTGDEISQLWNLFHITVDVSTIRF